MTGVLLVNIGSPASPSVKDVRRYLGEFLMDEHVLDIPRLPRTLLVRGIIQPLRARRSACAYRKIWKNNQFPLLNISQQLRKALEEETGMPVELAMRYGQPSIENGLLNLTERGVKNALLVPLYPHYAMSTYQSVVEKTTAILRKHGFSITLSLLPPFFAEPAYILALEETAAPYLQDEHDHLLFSYHGIPLRHLKKTDPTGKHCLSSVDCCKTDSPAHATCYRHQVLRTSEALAQRMGLPREKYSIAFQSRLGSDAWLQPSTADTLRQLAGTGKKRLAVICPSFVADCLETLEEIGMRGREIFLNTGGERFTLIPCLNSHPVWVQTLAEISQKAIAGRTGKQSIHREQKI